MGTVAFALGFVLMMVLDVALGQKNRPSVLDRPHGRAVGRKGFNSPSVSHTRRRSVGET